MTSLSGLAAGFVVAVHIAFVGFVVLGGLLVLRWPGIVWIHLPAAVWGVAIELGGGVCPLTPLENLLRARAGLSPYSADFVGQYLLPVLYPAGLSRSGQILLGLAAAGLNVAIYGWCLHRRGRGGPPRPVG